MKNLFNIFMITLFLGACAGKFEVPVINKSPDREIPDAYSVKQGDSVYNISWAFGLDYLDLIEWNKLQDPYTVSPGQVIYLREPEVKTTALASDEAQIVQTDIATTLPEKQLIESQPLEENTVTPAPSIKFSAFVDTWNWPAEGELSGKFSPSAGRNGIQISGVAGSPVKSSAAGEVVYVGEGIRGYGKLIIIKHSEQFLSAYAHNQEILVKEGQGIQSGQQIAKMGNSGAQTTMLHFEIRKDGKPVDPLGYLN